ncbi:MAG: TonB-dependent receptor domain-containing protein [Vicinamibacterales bacterium]
MNRMFLVPVVLSCLLASGAGAFAQTGEGSLVGYVKDEQGGVLPGVTVTATAAELIRPISTVTDSSGYYRLLNLPPGTYTVTAELAGFATMKREGVVMRAGSTFSVDIVMRIGTLTETVTVSAETPMLDVSRPGNAITIDGELLRSVPLTSRRIWSDAIDMTPGVNSRTVDTGGGQIVYYARGAEVYNHSFNVEGAPASAFADGAATGLSLSGDSIADVEVKLGAVDASSPSTSGVVVNIVTPRGGNTPKGSAGFTYQPLDWNSDNTKKGVGGGVPTIQQVKQFDMSLGGPVKRDRVWAFGTFRVARLVNGISRTETDIANLKALKPGFEPFDNNSRSFQPYVKVTSQLSTKHEVMGVYQYDRQRNNSDREQEAQRLNYSGYGGSLVTGRLSSVWTNRLSSQILVSWNNKSRENEDTWKDLNGSGPQVLVHKSASISGGRPVGSGSIATMNNQQSINLAPASALTIRADLTYFREAWFGSHELKAGIYTMPQSKYDITNVYQNDGFVLEEVRLADPANLSSALVPFHRRYRSPTRLQTRAARASNIAFYLQDQWKPNARLTATAGVRVDTIRRKNALYDLTTMKSTEVGPRVGVSYMLTSDARNILRASYSRVTEIVNGRDSFSGIGGAPGATTTDLYDANGDGVFEIQTISLPVTRSLAELEIDPDLHQPYIDEFVFGYRRQFPGQISIDVSGVRRYIRDTPAQIEINGYWPDSPGKPFGGFGQVDPNRGTFYQQTNNTWSHYVVTAFDAVVAKNMSRGVQLMATFSRQWQRLEGDWNPHDPARYIQPAAFPNNREIWRTAGNQEQNSLDGAASPATAAWRPFTFRMAGQWLAPWRLSIASSFILSAGDYSGPIVYRIDKADPVFGPSSFKLPNGSTVSNPLATTVRFRYPTRGEGQIRNDTVKALQIKVGRRFRFARQELEVAANVFNVLNGGNFQQYASGANQEWNPNYMRKFNRQPPRALQLTIVSRF